MKMAVFLNVAPCSRVDIDRPAPLKRLSISTRLHGATSQKTAILAQITYLMMLLFWVLAPFRLVVRYQRFGETYCLHLQGCRGDAGIGGTYIGFDGGKTEGVGH
jgi:hypothetical protein